MYPCEKPQRVVPPSVTVGPRRSPTGNPFIEAPASASIRNPILPHSLLFHCSCETEFRSLAYSYTIQLVNQYSVNNLENMFIFSLTNELLYIILVLVKTNLQRCTSLLTTCKGALPCPSCLRSPSRTHWHHRAHHAKEHRMKRTLTRFEREPFHPVPLSVQDRLPDPPFKGDGRVV